jgi:hypothetical protein
MDGFLRSPAAGRCPECKASPPRIRLQEHPMPPSEPLARQPFATPPDAVDPFASNPFDAVEFLPGLGLAVLYVVLAYAFVSLMLLPVHPG